MIICNRNKPDNVMIISMLYHFYQSDNTGNNNNRDRHDKEKLMVIFIFIFIIFILIPIIIPALAQCWVPTFLHFPKSSPNGAG